jgi:Ca2+-binding EF-hand superfamily protein
MEKSLKFRQKSADNGDMNRESFLETVRKQYCERISASYMICEHGGRVDVEELATQLKPLKRMAAREGLTHGEFDELVFSFFPDIRGKVDLEVRTDFQKAA